MGLPRAVARLLIVPASLFAAPRLPEGFTLERIASGITAATAMAIAPDGRIFICEQTGALRVVRGGALLPEPFLTVTVDAYWERGLIGVALDPRFPEAPHVYINHVAPRPHPHHRISRFTADGDRAAAGSELVLIEGDNQDLLGGSIPAGHQGGALHFGKDGKLYIGIGEQTAGEPAQRLETFQGKVLRIEPDGSIPEDNPFVRSARGKYRAIWATGLRNPFAFAVERASGRIFLNDVGGAAWEEINEGFPGANYGWPRSEGRAVDPAHRGPVFAYDHGSGKSITGGAFYDPPRKEFPPEYAGKYFFADFDGNWIKVLDPGRPGEARHFASGLERPVDLRVAPDGSLYCLNRNAWVNDGKLRPATGSLDRIRYLGKPGPGTSIGLAPLPGPAPRGAAAGLSVPPTADGLPPLLSRTGVFRSLRTLDPAPGLVPYGVNSPLWSDGARKLRWIALPGEARISFAEKGEWGFPAGTVFIKHFELPSGGGEGGRDRRLETRLLVVTGEGGYGATYRWRPDGSEADLLLDGERETLPGPPEGGQERRTWHYPGHGDCLVCHTVNAGFVLGVKTRQLNGPFPDPSTGAAENQLRAWSRRGMFDRPPREEDLPRLDRLAAIADASTPLEHRVRSYLDSNCAGCHRPGGARGLLDARYDAPLWPSGSSSTAPWRRETWASPAPGTSSAATRPAPSSTSAWTAWTSSRCPLWPWSCPTARPWRSSRNGSTGSDRA